MTDREQWKKRKLRTCYGLHQCEVCQGMIKQGELYRDGGYGKRAHEECVDKLPSLEESHERV